MLATRTCKKLSWQSNDVEYDVKAKKTALAEREFEFGGYEGQKTALAE